MATNPTLITTPFAESGDKTTPPNTNVPSDGRFSQTLGFPPVTAIPLGSGGKAPKREDFNGAFNMLANLLFYAQKGWIFQWDSGQTYYAGCIVRYSGNLYACTSDVTSTTAPSSDTSHWSKYNISPGTTYAPINSPAFTGTPTSPTPSSSDDSTKIATTAYVKSNLSSYAPKDSPTFTGTPTAPTPTSGDDSTKLATTAFVQDAVSGAGGIIAESLAQNGYVKFKDGLIVQWGRSNATGLVGTVGVTFPISFPSACYSVTTSGNAIAAQFTSTSNATGRGVCVDGGSVLQNSISSSGFTCASERQISWIATGK